LNPVRQYIPLLARHAGVWEGRYRHIDPDGREQETCLFRIAVEFPDEGAAYRQTSHYWWPDGRTDQLIFEAQYADGRLHWDSGRIRGSLWALDDMSFYLRFAFTEDPGSEVCEMIQLSADGEHRARTWHWFRGGRLWRITLVSERRVSLQPADLRNLTAAPVTGPG
jgi:predicted dehydrogenase